jgi:uncharacterized protein (TIGR02757 family)
MAPSQSHSRSRQASLKKARELCDWALKSFHHSRFLETDPLYWAHQVKHSLDQELIAWIAAFYAYGKVSNIHQVMKKMMNDLGQNPVAQLLAMTSKTMPGHPYRFYTSDDVRHFLLRTKSIYEDYGSLENFYRLGSGTPLDRLASMRERFLVGLPQTYGLKFALGNPHQGTAKRLHLWMRWMVRHDQLDLGLWSCVQPSELLLPLDTHVFGICQDLKLTRRVQPSLAACLEVTEILQSWNPEDPIRYDFALCRIGILGLRRGKNWKSEAFQGEGFQSLPDASQ